MRILYVAIAIITLFACSPEKGGAGTEVINQSQQDDYFEMVSTQIVKSLDAQNDETVVIGFDRKAMPGLATATKNKLSSTGAQVYLHCYGNDSIIRTLGEAMDIYIWLPFRCQPDWELVDDQFELLGEWMENTDGRQLHFHWHDGSRKYDGQLGKHTTALDSIYLRALNIDYGVLNEKMNKAIRLMRSGQVMITTPRGTALSMQFGDRYFTKQNGDASYDALKDVPVRVQREIELPAGALRVAPIEHTVNGKMVIPWTRITPFAWSNESVGIAKNLVLTFEHGKIVGVSADEGGKAFKALIDQYPALKRFRELAIGFNPKLCPPKNSDIAPYYGYGCGFTRLSLGNNLEVGGTVAGEGARWYFFDRATIRVGSTYIIRDGEILL